jgi:hypothetical protein
MLTPVGVGTVRVSRRSWRGYVAVEQPRAGDEHDRVDRQLRTSIRRAASGKRSSIPLPSSTMSSSSVALSSRTAATGSALRSVEFCHGRGSPSVLDTTSSCARRARARTGCPCARPRRPRVVRRSRGRTAWRRAAPAPRPRSSHSRRRCRPPPSRRATPPRRSSSGCPGACMTPSSETFSTAVILLMRGSSCGFNSSHYSNGGRQNRQRRQCA